MATNDSEDEVEGIDDLEFELRSSDAEDAGDDDMMDAEGEVDEGTEGDDVCYVLKCTPGSALLL